MLPSELTELVQNIVTMKCEHQNIELKRASQGTL